MNQVLKHMNQLKLYGMSRSYQTLIETGKTGALTNEEALELLLQSEWEDRQQRKIDRHLRNARFRYQASVEQTDFAHQRHLDKSQFLRLAEGSYITRREDVLVTGPTGAGKSFLASALGHQACQQGYRVAYYNTQKLFARLKMAGGDGSYFKEMTKIEKQDLLILDDFALTPMDQHQRNTLMEIIEDRHGRASTIVSSQLPVANWHQVIGESTIADAILDRLVHKAHRIELTGASMRKTIQKEK